MSSRPRAGVGPQYIAENNFDARLISLDDAMALTPLLDLADDDITIIRRGLIALLFRLFRRHISPPLGLLSIIPRAGRT